MDTDYLSRRAVGARLVVLVRTLVQLEADRGGLPLQQVPLQDYIDLTQDRLGHDPALDPTVARATHATASDTSIANEVRHVRASISALLGRVGITEEHFYRNLGKDHPTLAVMATVNAGCNQDTAPFAAHMRRDFTRQSEVSSSLRKTLRELLHGADHGNYSWDRAQGLEDYVEYQHWKIKRLEEELRNLQSGRDITGSAAEPL
ncbi:hypothetical protein VE04_08949 [Pseudogymnoascus sp. 24MN13]|nr:hypothetical protein VE04_08949 [Pseudogymnoascus sp. 24MN13]